MIHVTNINTGDVAATTLIQRLMNDCMDAVAVVAAVYPDVTLRIRWVDTNSYAHDWNAAIDVHAEGFADTLTTPAGSPAPEIERRVRELVTRCREAAIRTRRDEVGKASTDFLATGRPTR